MSPVTISQCGGVWGWGGGVWAWNHINVGSWALGIHTTVTAPGSLGNNTVNVPEWGVGVWLSPSQ